MRLATALILALAVTAIVGSSLAVITKDRPASLAVRVEGVPDYVYYDRAYEITIAFENKGGAVAGPVELSAWLPPTFALAEHIDDPTRHGERLTWVLDGLGAGERGSVEIRVQGTVPADLSEAVYDLPGYAGHTAFVEGFELAVALTAGSNAASALAVSDTGTVPRVVVFSKLFDPDSIESGEVSTLTFTIDNTGSGAPTGNLAFTDNLPAGVVVANPTNQASTCGGMLTATPGSGSLSFSGGSVGAGAACTIQVDVTSSTPGSHLNVSSDLTFEQEGDTAPATDTLTVTEPPPPGTPRPTATPPPNIAGALGPITSNRRPTPTPVVTANDLVITPPNTGDGGLR